VDSCVDNCGLEASVLTANAGEDGKEQGLLVGQTGPLRPKSHGCGFPLSCSLDCDHVRRT
jgi:hypothetical protein